MFTKITDFKQGWGDELNRTFAKFEDFESARTAGMQDACLNIVTGVTIQDNEGKILSQWQKLDNYWIDFKDPHGKFITPNNYFAKSRKKTEKFALEEGFNIRIRKNGDKWKVYAGEHVIPIEDRMIPWVHEAIEETQIRAWAEEDKSGENFSEEKLLNIFAEYLIHRISYALKRHPESWSRLRRSSLFKEKV